MKDNLIKLWHDVNDVVIDLEGMGYNSQRSLVQSLKEALDYLSEDIDNLEEGNEI